MLLNPLQAGLVNVPCQNKFESVDSLLLDNTRFLNASLFAKALFVYQKAKALHKYVEPY